MYCPSSSALGQSLILQEGISWQIVLNCKHVESEFLWFLLKCTLSPWFKQRNSLHVLHRCSIQAVVEGNEPIPARGLWCAVLAWHKFWHGLSWAFPLRNRNWPLRSQCLFAWPRGTWKQQITLPLGSNQGCTSIPKSKAAPWRRLEVLEAKTQTWVPADFPKRKHMLGRQPSTGPKTEGKFARALGKGVAALV